MSNIKLSIPKSAIRQCAADDSWLDLKCTHFAPNNGGIEAFDFRLTTEKGRLFRIEIHWDNGEMQVIGGSLNAASAVDIINGYYIPNGQCAPMDRHARETHCVFDLPLFSVVDAACIGFETRVTSAVDEIEIEILSLECLDSGESTAQTINKYRLSVTSELKKIRSDMDAVFRIVIAGEKSWSHLKFMSVNSINIVSEMLDLFDAVSKEMRQDQSYYTWVHTELKCRLRLCLQENYQQRLAPFV
jgi:hypothetical protein